MRLLLEAADGNRDVLCVAYARLGELTTPPAALRTRALWLLVQATGTPDTVGTAAPDPR